MALSEFSWLCRYSRPIRVRGRNVQVLSTPQEFYGALLRGVQTAKRRIVLSSLYLGTGEHEQQLVDSLGDALSDSQRPNLQCSVLLDCLRGTRGHPNSVSLLQPLLTTSSSSSTGSHSRNFSLHLYHTPNLRGLAKKVFPERINEGMGLQHTKIYIFDNSLLLSGANMSHDYFTNRQDRYILFSESKTLADFFSRLAETISSHSYTVEPDLSMRPMLGFDHLSSSAHTERYKRLMSESVGDLVNSGSDSGLQVFSGQEEEGEEEEKREEEEEEEEEEEDTVVFPLLQMGSYGIRQEEEATARLLAGLTMGERLCLASGYFNLPPRYTRALLSSAGDISVLAASPQAFGFFGAPGVAGHVPVMYTHFAKQFLRQIYRRKSKERIRYSEFFREGWTFHAKGMWYYLKSETLPSLTLIGSSNYGHRSLTRDLEAQVAMVTTNQELREKLHSEQEHLFSRGSPLTLEEMECAPNRKLKVWQWIVTTLLKPHV